MKKPIIVILLLAAHLLLLIKVQFTAWPEMSTWPYLLLHNLMPYKDIAMAHTPLLITILAGVYKIFGTGILQLQIFTWILILITDIGLYLLMRKVSNSKAAVIALLSYISLQVFYQGNGLWFDLALAPLALLAYHLLRKKKFVWAGVVWGIAFLTKQTAFWFLAPVAFVILSSSGRWIKLVRFIAGSLAVFVSSGLVLYLAGIWVDFWFWAVKFGVTFLPQAKGQILFPALRQFTVYLFPFVILFYYLARNHEAPRPYGQGIFSHASSGAESLRSKNTSLTHGLTFGVFAKGDKRDGITLVLFALAGLMGLYPRWELFHFQPALPFLAIVIGICLAKFDKAKNFAKISLVLYSLAIAVLFGRFVVRNWTCAVRLPTSVTAPPFRTERAAASTVEPSPTASIAASAPRSPVSRMISGHTATTDESTMSVAPTLPASSSRSAATSTARMRLHPH